MNMLKKLIHLLLLWVACATQSFAQQNFKLQAEYRLNPLYSHGYRVPVIGDKKDEGYVSQRTRIIMNYEKEGDMSSEIILQDLRAWGTYNNNGQAGNLSIFRAWVEKQIVDGLSIKVGRQGFIYGDEFILGGLNWGGNMAHDAALFKYEKSGFKAHLAAAYNSTGFTFQPEVYSFKNHKNMQFLWLQKDTDRLSIATVFLNRGLEKPDGSLDIRYDHTTGVNASFKITDKLNLKGIYYYQFGKDTVGTGRQVNAFLYSAQAKFTPNKNITFTLGTDVVSGESTADAANPDYNQRNNFDILFGLRHGNFGYLDYFYTRLWPVSGLEDYYLKTNVKTGQKSNMDIHVHGFFSQNKVYNETFSKSLDDYYGTELDLRWHYKQSDNTKITLGYSHMWVTDTYMSYYDGASSEGSSTFYAVITVKPTFLNHSF
ncbi:alginate export family protein [Reichenbachiella agarivorans]|uniref:Alginate export family protein n=1 Tax=Reichenbachiella agarivorans TaxID=2979464 RepID=A0ABY6CQT0_9BACT|nr:alginate export family protein [Reichenbachiella agarivorans]UXP31808.1 alginate export family protein [Reichenbachiella agarivorans]